LALIAKQGFDVLVFVNEDSPLDFGVKFWYANGVKHRLYVERIEKRQLLLPKDNSELESVMASKPWGAIYFDSIGDLKAFNTNMNAADAARSLYGPLSDYAQRYNTAVMCTAHTNKMGVLEGAMQIRAKARVVAKVEKPKMDMSGDEVDMDNFFDPDWHSIVTTEKFSRGVAGRRHVFSMEEQRHVNPDTGEVYYDYDENGDHIAAMLRVCTGHKEITRVHVNDDGSTVTRESKEEKRDKLKMKIGEILRENPDSSTRDVQKQVTGDRSVIVEIMRELKL
jgi:hypothetical protein